MGLRRKCDMRILAVLGVALLLLTGCMTGPDYVPPKLDVPAAFRHEDGEAQQTANINWWKQFEDPALDLLIDEALGNNRNIKIAAANIEQAAAVLLQVRSRSFPRSDTAEPGEGSAQARTA